MLQYTSSTMVGGVSMIPHASNIYLIYGSFVVRSLLVSVLLSRELPTHPHMHSSNTFLEFHHKCVFPLRSSFIAKFLDQLSASAIYNISKAYSKPPRPCIHYMHLCVGNKGQGNWMVRFHFSCLSFLFYSMMSIHNQKTAGMVPESSTRFFGCSPYNLVLQ